MKEQLKNLNLSTWISQADTEKIEKVTDEYAIGFARFYYVEKIGETKETYQSAEKILEIYKKEIEKL